MTIRHYCQYCIEGIDHVSIIVFAKKYVGMSKISH